MGDPEAVGQDDVVDDGDMADDQTTTPEPAADDGEDADTHDGDLADDQTTTSEPATDDDAAG